MSFGMLGLKLLQLAHEQVELGVGQLGVVEDVIAVFVMADLVAQFVDLSLDVGSRSHFFDYSGTLE